MTRLATRILGTIIAAFWILSLVASTIAEFLTSIILEAIILAVLVITNTIGVIIDWGREKISGIIIVFSAVALCTFAYVTADHNKILAMPFSGFLFLASGILFLIIRQRSNKLNTKSYKPTAKGGDKSESIYINKY